MRGRLGNRGRNAAAGAATPLLDEDKYLAFRVGDRRYLLEILRVKEVVRLQKMTAMPNSPDAIAGVIDLRGGYVPVLDMRRHTGVEAESARAAAEDEPRRRIIVTVLRGRLAGLLVDELLPVMRVPAADMKAPPRMARDLGYDFLTAMSTRDGEVYMLINSDRLLDRFDGNRIPFAAGDGGVRAGARRSPVDA
jgi:purine-binding chemotaxis protein CheW